MKVLAEELKTITYLGEKTENDITFTVPIEKEVTIIDKNVNVTENITKIYLLYYTLLMAQYLGQIHCQILSIIFLKKFIKLNLNLDMMIKRVIHVELNISIATVFLNTWIYYNTNFDEKLKE